MKLELYTAIVNRLNEKMNAPMIIKEYGKLNYIARFRNQFNNPEETIPSPAIAIEFSSIQYNNKSKGIQEGAFVVRIHSHWRSLAKQQMGVNEVEGVKSLKFQKEINKALHNWTPECFTTLIRTEEVDDVNYGFGVNDVLVYTTTAEDNSADKRGDQIEVEVDLEVDGETLIIPPNPDTTFPFKT